MSGAKEVLIGLIIFSVIIVAASSYLASLSEGSGVSVDTTELDELDTFNKTYEEVNAIKERIKGAETNPLGTVSILATGGWIAVKNLFNLIPLAEDVGHVVTNLFGVPEWIYYSAIALLTIIIIFLILGYVTGR